MRPGNRRSVGSRLASDGKAVHFIMFTELEAKALNRHLFLWSLAEALRSVTVNYRWVLREKIWHYILPVCLGTPTKLHNECNDEA